MPVITVFEERAQEYDEWFDAHKAVYQAEVTALQTFVPRMGLGIEIGVGTGRFAVPLGLKLGIDPSRRMLEIARRRGLTVCQAVGERLPFHDGQFDLVLLVTVMCFVDDVPTLLQELRRVLNPDGRLVSGFINRESELGRHYEERKETSAFYREAQFYAVEQVAHWVQAAGFQSLQFCQTLSGSPEKPSRRDLQVREGYSEGAFVVLSATNAAG
jgi:ubiquinone/menaquinone biosynthesis C-methylase UbiE